MKHKDFRAYLWRFHALQGLWLMLPLCPFDIIWSKNQGETSWFVWVLEDSMQLVDFMFKNHDQRLDFLQCCLPGIVTTWATTFAPTVTMVTFGSFLPVWQRDGILNLARQGPVWPKKNDSNDHFAASSTQSRYALLWQNTWIFRSRPQLGGSRTMVDLIWDSGLVFLPPWLLP